MGNHYGGKNKEKTAIKIKLSVLEIEYNLNICKLKNLQTNLTRPKYEIVIRNFV